MVAGVFFSSCTNELEIKQTSSGTYFKYKAACGPTFTKTIAGITGEEDAQLFNAEQIKNLFSETGVEDLNVVTIGKDGFMTNARLSKDGEDVISKSNMIFSTENKLRVEINPARLQELYGSLPEELKGYIDLFMSPSFTGEIMKDDEYLDLIGTVYGQEMADEFKNAKVKVTLVRKDGTTKRFSVDLVHLLNLTGTIAFIN